MTDLTGISTAGAGTYQAAQASDSTLPTFNFAPSENDKSLEDQAMAVYSANPKLQQYIQGVYGYESWALQNPELLRVIVSAAVGGWDQARMSGALQATDWYKTASSSMRGWQALLQTDPATAQQQIANQKGQIHAQAQSIGVNLSDAQATNLATSYLQFGWDQTTLDQTLRHSYYQPTADPGSGQAATIASGVRQLAGQYLTPVSDNLVNYWTTTGVQNTTSGGEQGYLDGLRQYFANNAANLYPFMKDALSKGMTAQQFLDPYTQQAAKVLDVSPDSIDWTKPKWMGALTTSAADGTLQAHNITEFTRNLMSDPSYGYQNTKDAMNQAYSVADTLTKNFGKVAS